MKIRYMLLILTLSSILTAMKREREESPELLPETPLKKAKIENVTLVSPEGQEFKLPQEVGQQIDFSSKPGSNVETVTLVSEGKEFQVPAQIAKEIPGIKDMLFTVIGENDLLQTSKKRLEFTLISQNTLQELSNFMWAAYTHRNLKNKAFLDAVEKDVIIKDPMAVIKAAFFLEWDLPITIITRDKVQKNESTKFIEDIDNSFPGRRIDYWNREPSIEQEQIRNKIGRYEFLVNDKKPPKRFNYGISIQDLLDYRKDFASKFIREDNSLDFFLAQNVHLNSLDGLQNIPQKKSIESLHITDGNLQKIPNLIFNGYSNLTYLYFINNKIQIIEPLAFQGIKNLGFLDLRENQIENLDVDVFKDLEKLTMLFLQSNKLETIENAVFSHLSNLQVLNLDYNPLKKLNAESLNSLFKIKSIHLKDTHLSLENKKEIEAILKAINPQVFIKW